MCALRRLGTVFALVLDRATVVAESRHADRVAGDADGPAVKCLRENAPRDFGVIGDVEENRHFA